MTFEDKIVNDVVDRLVKGEPYRDLVIKAIDAKFFTITEEFLLNIEKKGTSKKVDWYKDLLVNNEKIEPLDRMLNSGLNKKTITNIYGNAKKETLIEKSSENIDYLYDLIDSYESKVAFEGVLLGGDSPKFTFKELLLMINSLATRKMSIRGGAWSSIGKKVEKPLVARLLDLTGVPKVCRKEKFVKDKKKGFDREVDYFIFNKKGREIRVEVKLMGKGNPESADAIIARDTNIFIADTLSSQNINQINSLGVKCLMLKDNKNVIDDFIEILEYYNIEHSKQLKTNP